MLRLATLFSIFLLASALFDDDPELSLHAPSVRNAGGVDIRGIYLLEEATGEASDLCPQNITHTTWRRISDGSIGLPHNTIVQDNARCEASGEGRSLRFYQGTDYDDEFQPRQGVDTLPDDFLSVMMVSTFNANARMANQQSGARYLMGYEQVIRVCDGNTNFGIGTTAFLMRPTKADIVIKNLLTPLTPRRKYLLMVPRFRQTYCLYSSDVNGPDDDFRPIASDEFEPEMTELPVPSDELQTQQPFPSKGRPPVVATNLPRPGPQIGEEVLPTEEFGELEPSSSPGIDASLEGNDDDDDDGVCFPADGMVTLSNGDRKSMEEVALGDDVHIGNGVYSKVFSFTHNDRYKKSSFITLHTRTHAISATPGHYVYINKLVSRIETAKIGDVLTLGNGGEEVVENVERSVKRGLYNPQTVVGDIVVDGIRATTYTKTVDPRLAHAALAPVRALYNVFRVDILTRFVPEMKNVWNALR